MHAWSGEQQHVVPEVSVHMSIFGRCIVLMPVSVLPVQLRPSSASLLMQQNSHPNQSSKPLPSPLKCSDHCHALSIAGVKLMPFHVKGPSLPELTSGQWDSLIQSSHAASSSSDNVAAVLLSEPHFVQVQTVLIACINCLQTNACHAMALSLQDDDDSVTKHCALPNRQANSIRCACR